MEFKRASGILMHPTSLPSEFGIGDLGSSAYNFVDFLEKAGQKLWQILPLGPTGYGNSPYACYSAFAGNTNLISPEMLYKQGYLDKEDLSNLPEFSKEKVDYQKMEELKNPLYKKSFENFKTKLSEEEKHRFFYFCDENHYWLQDFSVFMALKEHFFEKAKMENRENDCKTWVDWPIEIVQRQPAVLSEIDYQFGEEIFYHKYLQYQFFKQWLSLKDYANKKGIQIIGDIPIFVAHDSADVWANQELFLLDEKGTPIEVAGVPPDYFSETGQLWGNPLYNWQEMYRTGFSWWVERIRMTLKLVDIVRIDHFRGFESYWSIPYGSPNAITGQWKKAPGKELFTAINHHLGDLPIIAEDLGIITPEVEQLRDYFEFPGMKILQFAFTNTGKDPFLPHNYKTNCVVYPGTHDNDTCLGWFNTAPEKEKEYFLRYSNSSGENIHWDFIKLGMNSVSNMFIFALQDALGLGTESRMNMPSKPDGNWEWVLKQEDLTKELADKIKTLTEDAYR
ncbi:MAG: 4-alpha-glucanotransferase [Candidatus Sericytochromatia bacterium]